MTSKTAFARELILLLVLSTLWGASYSFIKLGVATIPPIALIAARTLIAGAILLGVLGWRGVRMPGDAVTWCKFAFQAALNSVIPFTLIASAERTVDAGLAAILNSTSPILAFLMVRVFVSHERVCGRKLFGVSMGLLGICLVVGFKAFSDLGAQTWAQLAIVAATVCYAGAAIFGRTFNRLDPMVPAAGSLICGAAVLSPLSIVVDRPWTLAPSAKSLVALAALSVFSTALAFVIYFRLVRTIGSVGATAQAYLRVPIGFAISVAFLGEAPTAAACFGLCCVAVGVAAMTLPTKEAVAVSFAKKAERPESRSPMDAENFALPSDIVQQDVPQLADELVDLGPLDDQRR
jgi:drug/metabolite transporter (DMT)-like permease